MLFRSNHANGLDAWFVREISKSILKYISFAAQFEGLGLRWPTLFGNSDGDRCLEGEDGYGGDFAGRNYGQYHVETNSGMNNRKDTKNSENLPPSEEEGMACLSPPLPMTRGWQW